MHINSELRTQSVKLKNTIPKLNFRWGKGKASSCQVAGGHHAQLANSLTKAFFIQNKLLSIYITVIQNKLLSIYNKQKNIECRCAVVLYRWFEYFVRRFTICASVLNMFFGNK